MKNVCRLFFLARIFTFFSARVFNVLISDKLLWAMGYFKISRLSIVQKYVQEKAVSVLMTDSVILFQTNRATMLLCAQLDSQRTRSHVNLRLRDTWVTYTYIEYSLYVPLLFLWEGRSQVGRQAIPVPFPAAVIEWRCSLSAGGCETIRAPCVFG